jgi:tetratricopeptide (TPR) repeat protein
MLTLSRASNVLEAGDLDGFDASLARMTELLEAVPQPIMRWRVTFTEMPRAIIGGRLEEADALAIRAFQESGGSADGLTIFGNQIANVRWEQGRMHELVDLLAQAVTDNPAIPGFKAGHAAALCSAGNYDEARELLGRAVAEGFASVPLDLVWTTTLALWSEVAFRVGSTEAAAPLYDLLLPHSRRIVWTGSSVWGPIARHLGRLALTLERYEEAETHLAAATAEHERLGAPVWQADTDRLLGLTLLRRPGGDADRGRELLMRATETARDHGAAGIERETEEALAEVAQR